MLFYLLRSNIFGTIDLALSVAWIHLISVASSNSATYSLLPLHAAVQIKNERAKTVFCLMWSKKPPKSCPKFSLVNCHMKLAKFHSDFVKNNLQKIISAYQMQQGKKSETKASESGWKSTPIRQSFPLLH